MGERPEVGSIGWIDLTVADAEGVRDFYAAVVGWTPVPTPVAGYDDFTMQLPDSGKAVAGICHALGPNVGLPAQWLMYVTVADLDASVAQVNGRGGEVIVGPKGESYRYAVIRDPAGAVCALIQYVGKEGA